VPRNGVGVYSLPATSWNPATTGATIESTGWNTTAADLASALTQSLSKDGQTTMTGALPMGNNKIINLADGSASTDAMAFGQGAKLAGGNTFTGAQTFNGSISLSGSLTVTGPVIFTGGGSISVENLTVTSIASVGLLVTSGVQLDSSLVGSAAAPILHLLRSSSGSASNNLGAIAIEGKNNAGSTVTYAQAGGKIATSSTGNEGGIFAVNTILSGSVAERVAVGAGIYTAGAVGGDKGVNTFNAQGYYYGGFNFSTGVVTNGAFVSSATYQTCSTAIPDDDSIPQIGEGDLVLSINYTPRSNVGNIRIRVSIPVFNSTTVNACVALFSSGAGSSALFARQFGSNTATFPKVVSFEFQEVAISTAARTYTVRVGPASGSVYINGNAGSRTLGGVSIATMSIDESIP
jgi:hypothetical protein